MNHSKQFRLPLLAVNFAAAVFVLGKSILEPTVGILTPFDFPPDVSLPQWQPVESKSLEVVNPDGEAGSTFLVGRQYQYLQNDYLLDIEMRYVVRTQGEVNLFIQKHPLIQSSPPEEELSGKIIHRQGTGFSVFFTHQERAYLSACINPRGESTVTIEQFSQNQDTYDTQLSRLFPVLLGRETWRDNRCLWTYMSLPLQDASPEQAYRILEAAWESWYEWWSQNFPQV
ncbi:MAG: cyanoexosortase A system-associated protein [Symploca sp. SIO3E6]|nr:cyanoexosortase A system-associated protein [Caldora sp. SIO3E6]